MILLSDIFREHGPAYLARFGDRMLSSHRRALVDITACRTPAMGGRLVLCDDCERWHYVYHSCRNRACAQCRTAGAAQWVEDRANELVPGVYFHVIFTLPSELRSIARQHQKAVLCALMQTAVSALQTLAAEPRFASGRLAILAVLHTWSRALVWHPHLHCLVPAVSVASDRTWRRIHDRFLVPVKALSSVFRARFVKRLRATLPGVRIPQKIWQKDWVSFARFCPEGPGNVLRYLARYVFGGPMRGRRILGMDGDRYVLQYRDRDAGCLRTVRLTPTELIRRYLQHTPPPGFHRIRYYGWWAPSARRTLRTVQLQLAPGLGARAAEIASALCPAQEHPEPRCPHCGSSRLRLVARWHRGQNPPDYQSIRAPPAL